MLIQVCLLLLSVGVYASYADSSSESTTDDELFDKLVFPEHFLKKFPAEGEFFRLKIFVYLFFNIFSKYFAENQPVKFWSKFNRNDFNRIAMDALFYEYLTKFADRKMKPQVYDPLKRSKRSPEDIAIDRIGDYLDKLSAAEVPVEKSETLHQATEGLGHRDAKCAKVSLPTPISGIPGKDYPNYCDIPKTRFTCRNKLVPWIYADVETECQVFHVCWPHRMDSFLCPIGTTFNQNLRTCDFWYETDCSSAPLLFPSPFSEGKTLRNTERTATVGDETQTTSESSSVFTPDQEIPEYDGTCQSLISRSMQRSMKFLPAECKAMQRKPSTPKTSGSIKTNEQRLMILTEELHSNQANARKLLIKAMELAGKALPVVTTTTKRPKARKEKPNREPNSKFVKASKEFTSKLGEIDTMSEEQVQQTITELPFDELPPLDSGFVERPAFEEHSQAKAKHGRYVTKSTLLKPSKMSEDSKKHALEMMMRTLELGAKVLSDEVLPLVERIVLTSPKKAHKTEKNSPVDVQ